MKALHKKTPYRVCPHCGAHLDAGETCDCRQEPQRESAPPERVSANRSHYIAIWGDRA